MKLLDLLHRRVPSTLLGSSLVASAESLSNLRRTGEIGLSNLDYAVRTGDLLHVPMTASVKRKIAGILGRLLLRRLGLVELPHQPSLSAALMVSTQYLQILRGLGYHPTLPGAQQEFTLLLTHHNIGVRTPYLCSESVADGTPGG